MTSALRGFIFSPLYVPDVLHRYREGINICCGNELEFIICKQILSLRILDSCQLHVLSLTIWKVTEVRLVVGCWGRYKKVDFVIEAGEPWEWDGSREKRHELRLTAPHLCLVCSGKLCKETQRPGLGRFAPLRAAISWRRQFIELR